MSALPRRTRDIASGLVIAAALLCTAQPTAIGGEFEDVVRPLADLIIADGAPGVIVFHRDGVVTESFVAGAANVAAAIPMSVDRTFRTGSITKMFVAAAVGQLVDRGLIQLDDRAATLLPELLEAGDPTTIRQLLNHTSGYAEYWGDPTFQTRLYGDPTGTWKPTELASIGLAGDRARSGWHYANTNYVLLGLIVEAMTGERLDVAIRNLVLSPLELTETRFALQPPLDGRFVSGYDDMGSGQPIDITLVNPTAAWAAGNVVSSALDLADFLRALMREEIVSPPMLHEMKQVVPAEPGLSYGLGLSRIDLACGYAWGHQGEFAGYLSFALTSDDGTRQAIVLANSSSLSDNGRATFRHLVEAVHCAGLPRE